MTPTSGGTWTPTPPPDPRIPATRISRSSFCCKRSTIRFFSTLFAAELIPRICNTFISVLWSNAPDASNPTFQSHLDPGAGYGSVIVEQHTFRWLWLYEYQPQVGELINSFYQDNVAGWWFSEPLGNLACWQASLPIDEPRLPADDQPDAGTGGDDGGGGDGGGPGPAGAEEGCGCRTGGRGRTGGEGWLLLLAVALSTGLRRRRRVGPS